MGGWEKTQTIREPLSYTLCWRVCEGGVLNNMWAWRAWALMVLVGTAHASGKASTLSDFTCDKDARGLRDTTECSFSNWRQGVTSSYVYGIEGQAQPTTEAPERTEYESYTLTYTNA